MTAAHKDKEIINAARAALDALKATCPSLVFATLVTDDGFEVASYPASHQDDGGLAGMSSSVQALADAVGREMEVGESDYVIIASRGGHIIQRRVPGLPLVLAAVFDHAETLGKALSVSRVSAERLGRIRASTAATPAA
ncbi:roadblock/LC7 domain-containing protein [Salinibacterium sp. ZJ70]|uniref:roadblock/LC7 domain-containing protein n=1 Tax=Salinibacterium sp. ZJ70 TaxID=2708084 RepID=UPI00141EAD6D|nr:roadblock/LC7 domain-containing protein [Salinibacterium sp. ZJ70]